MKYKYKTLQEQGREKQQHSIHFVSNCLAREKKKRRKKERKTKQKVSSWLSECLKCFPFECF